MNALINDRAKIEAFSHEPKHKLDNEFNVKQTLKKHLEFFKLLQQSKKQSI